MSIWKVLSAVDCSAKIEKKGKLNFLSWAWAWAAVMEHYPLAVYSFDDPAIFSDGSIEVRCTVTIEELTHSMWLPVMDNKNNAIANPDSRKVSDAKMRCLVKCLAMFGLGHYIYAGEDLPQDSTGKIQFTLNDTAKRWVKGILTGVNNLEEINDLDYREFIKNEAGIK